MLRAICLPVLTWCHHAMSSPKRLYDLIRQVRPLYWTLYRAVEMGLKGSELTVGDRAVLECLHDRGAQTVPELAVQLDLERQPVQRIVDRMLTAQHVARVNNPRSIKSPKIALTAAGSRAIERVFAHEAKSLRRVAKGIDANELETAIGVLSQVIEGFAAKKGE